jgi:hypothetical protein
MADESANSRPPFWWPDASAFVIAAIILIAAGALFYRMTHPTEVNDKVLDMMLTIIFGTALVAIINFLFGSSRGSQAKDDTINKIALMPTPSRPAPAPLTDADRARIAALEGKFAAAGSLSADEQAELDGLKARA